MPLESALAGRYRLLLLCGFLLLCGRRALADCGSPFVWLIEEGLQGCEHKATLLDYHNELRNRVAAGRREGFPPARNMLELRWSRRAEADARKLSKTCGFRHHPKGSHNKFGESINLINSKRDIGKSTPRQDLLRRHMDTWFSEPYDFGSKAPPWNNLTQALWERTARVGCSHAYFWEDGTYSSLLVCEYRPQRRAGDAVAPPYAAGETVCGPAYLRRSKRYDSLCTVRNNLPWICRGRHQTSTTHHERLTESP